MHLFINNKRSRHLQCYTKTPKYNNIQWHTITHEESVDNVWHKVDKRQWVCVKRLRPNTELTTERSQEKTRHRTMNGSLRTSHGMTWRDVTWRDAVSWENDDFMSVFKQCLSLVTWQTSTFKSSEYLTEVHKCSEMLWRTLQTLVFYLTWVSTCMCLRVYGQLFLEQCNSTSPNHPSISNDKR